MLCCGFFMSYNFNFCLSFLLSLGIHNVAHDLLLPLPGPMGDSSVETPFGYNYNPPEQGRLFWEGVCQAARSAPNLLIIVEIWWFSHQFSSYPFAFGYWIMLLRKIIQNLETGKRDCSFSVGWDWLADPHPPGIIWFSRDVYLCLTPYSLLFKLFYSPARWKEEVNLQKTQSYENALCLRAMQMAPMQRQCQWFLSHRKDCPRN